MKVHVLLSFALSLNALVPICSFSSIVLSNSLNRAGTSLKALTVTSPQLLQFQEPQTNVTVVLVGAMHYNPTSIRLAGDTIRDLGNQNKLGSVIVESCDLRWNKTAELYNEKPYLKSLLNNEMRTAYDVAFSFGRPTVLGDQRINVTSNALKSTFKETLVDLITPLKGWKRFLDEVTSAWDETVPLGGKGYLNAFAFFDPRLLLVLPVSLVKYPLAFLVRDPIPTTVALSLLVALTYTDDPMTTQVLMNEELPLSDWITSLAFAGLETAVFARLLLKPLLAERNKILARSILDQCKIYAGEKEPVRRGWFDLFSDSNNVTPASAGDETEVVYAPGNLVVQNSAADADGKIVVAVLGMAHCNGIMKLLKEQKV